MLLSDQGSDCRPHPLHRAGCASGRWHDRDPRRLRARCRPDPVRQAPAPSVKGPSASRPEPCPPPHYSSPSPNGNAAETIPPAPYYTKERQRGMTYVSAMHSRRALRSRRLNAWMRFQSFRMFAQPHANGLASNSFRGVPPHWNVYAKGKPAGRLPAGFLHVSGRSKNVARRSLRAGGQPYSIEIGNQHLSGHRAKLFCSEVTSGRIFIGARWDIQNGTDDLERRPKCVLHNEENVCR